MPLLRASQLAASRAAGSRQSALERHEVCVRPHGVVPVSETSGAEDATSDDAQRGSAGAHDGSDDAEL